ncbi:hypothetical protein HS7_21120 [Sulfolobales archaeon HS-7]|nr:hypothetical protein HS7_21120 [Sulfolobales archaeon HS-7]
MAKDPVAYKVSLVNGDDLSVLKTILRLHSNHEMVQRGLVQRLLTLSPNLLNISLEKLYQLHLIRKTNVRGRESFRITFTGMDVLSIKELSMRGVIKSIGEVIGVGKESIVYLGENFNGEKIAIKLYTIKRTSFRNFRKTREIEKKIDWIAMSIQSAKTEYRNLECVSRKGGKVPKPYGHYLNAVVMEYFNGKELQRVFTNKPSEIFDEIIATVNIAYNECNVIHSDLSPYNVLVNGEDIRVIDWSNSSHDRLKLEKDIGNIITYFNKKYNFSKSVTEILDLVRG